MGDRVSEKGRETGRGDRGRERKETERERWGRGRRDNLTKLKASAISEKQERRQTWRRSGRAQAGVNSLLVLPLLFFNLLPLCL